MSYGVWKKHDRKNGWSSCEIDSPHRADTLSDWGSVARWATDRDYQGQRVKIKYGFLRSKLRKHMPDCSVWDSLDHATRDFEDDNVDYLKWRVYQAEKYPERKVASWYLGGGEHCTWIAFESLEAIKNALSQLTYDKEEYDACLGSVMRRHYQPPVPSEPVTYVM